MAVRPWNLKAMPAVSPTDGDTSWFDFLKRQKRMIGYGKGRRREGEDGLKAKKGI